GFGLLHLRYLNRSYFETMGDFTFSGIISGNAAADFLLGRAQSLTVASPVLEQAGLQTNTYYFIQDDWKIMSRLTLNLGLRYELPPPWVHPHDYWGTLRLRQQCSRFPPRRWAWFFRGIPEFRAGSSRPIPTTSRRDSASPGTRSDTAVRPYAAPMASFMKR